MRHITAIIVACIAITSIQAQNVNYSIEFTGAMSDGNYTPFWHLSNRQGLSSIDTKSAYMRAGVSGQHLIANNKLNIAWGADIITSYNHTSTFFIQQAFADIKYKKIQLSLGQKERWGNFKPHRLTSGSLTESGNARPIPQIRLEIPEYWDMFNTKGWFSLRGHIAYGWFSDGEWQKDFVAKGKQHTSDVRYHSKAGFVKIGNEGKFPLTFEGGLEMVAQFGGKTYNMEDEEGRNKKNPASLKDYWKAFIPSSGDDRYSGMDQANIAGNHLGSWHAALTWHSNDWNIRTYYEHTFEDHSQMFMEYGIWTEQLVGIELELKEFKWIKNIIIEYFNLKNQSGPIYHDATNEIPDQISCEDDNYNHDWYTGWFNYGMTIGTPLVTSPIYNGDGTLKSKNNRVEAFHVGFEGDLHKDIAYRILLTSSNNWGTYKEPFTEIKESLSGLFEFTYSPAKLKGWSATASFSFDNGDLYGNNNGGMISIRKNGLFNIKSNRK